MKDITVLVFQKIKIIYNFYLIGSSPLDFRKVILGSWERGQKYALDIIEVCICVQY